MNKDQFEYVTAWQRETFPSSTALAKVKHLEQEVKELEADLISNNKDRALEFADCFILLLGAADCDGMSYEDIHIAIERKMEINKARMWGKPDANGVVNHIK